MHGHLLRFYLDCGMKLVQVHCAICLTANPYFEPYINNNTKAAAMQNWRSQTELLQADKQCSVRQHHWKCGKANWYLAFNGGGQGTPTRRKAALPRLSNLWRVSNRCWDTKVPPCHQLPVFARFLRPKVEQVKNVHLIRAPQRRFQRQWMHAIHWNRLFLLTV